MGGDTGWSGLSSICMIGILIRRKQTSQSQKSERREDALWLSLKITKGEARAKECRHPLEAEKAKEKDSSLELLEETQPYGPILAF